MIDVGGFTDGIETHEGTSNLLAKNNRFAKNLSEKGFGFLRHFLTFKNEIFLSILINTIENDIHPDWL